MEFQKEFENYIEQVKAKVDGMQMVAANAYPFGIGIRATDDGFTTDRRTTHFCDLFSGVVYDNEREITNLYEITEGCMCVVSDQILVGATIVQFKVGTYKVEDVVDINDKVFFKVRREVQDEKNVDVFDKIRSEIEHVIDSTDRDKSLYNGAYKDGLYEALNIIDFIKYKAEVEPLSE